MSLFLTPDELQELTGRCRPSAQARMLDRLGISYIDHPEGPRVLRQDVESAAGETGDDQEPDFSAIRQAG